MAEARARGDNPDAGLYVVQFAGPIQDAWLETLESTGADVISYVSNNAYVVLRCVGEVKSGRRKSTARVSKRPTHRSTVCSRARYCAGLTRYGLELSPMESPTKICQQCKEEIKASAKKCRYCHSIQGGIGATLSNPAYAPFVGIALAIPLMLVAYYFFISRLDRDVKAFEKYRSLVVVQDSKIHYAKEGDNNFVSTIGVIKNNSDKKWKELRIEVQYFNQSGALIDTQSDTAYSLVLLPNTEHAFRVREPADKPEAEYASHKVFIRDVRDADSWP